MKHPKVKPYRIPFSAPMFEGVYRRGVAVGESNIRTDTMTFRWRDEVFEFSTSDALKVAVYNGYFYEAKVKQLRKLALEKTRGRL